MDDQRTFKYLALGDSYTIGEAVSEEDRWPVQLAARLSENNIRVQDPTIVATTGWTTDELQSALSRVRLAGPFDMVSLLIGVNNQYRGYPVQQYETEFEALVDSSIAHAGGKSENVFVVSIPDYGVTPFAANQGLDPEKISRELDEYNTIAKRIAESKGVQFFEITQWSRNAKDDPSLIASDGLHPSGKMYTNWVDTCYDWVSTNLKSR